MSIEITEENAIKAYRKGDENFKAYLKVLMPDVEFTASFEERRIYAIHVGNGMIYKLCRINVVNYAFCSINGTASFMHQKVNKPVELLDFARDEGYDVVEFSSLLDFVEWVSSIIESKDDIKIITVSDLIQHCFPTVRLYNILVQNFPNFYIEDIKKKDFMSKKNAGKITWEELQQIK